MSEDQEKSTLKTSDAKPPKTIRKITKHLVPSDSWSETVEINPESGEFEIKRTWTMYQVWKNPITNSWEKEQLLTKEAEWRPLGVWGFCKKLKTVVVVFRVFQLRDIQRKQEVIYYSLPVEYSIRKHPKSKNLYLKGGERQSTQYVGRRKIIKRKFSTINLRDLKTDHSFPIHSLNQEELPTDYPFSFLDIKQGKAKEISKDRVETMVQSGQVMRITDEDLKRRVILTGGGF